MYRQAGFGLVMVLLSVAILAAVLVVSFRGSLGLSRGEQDGSTESPTTILKDAERARDLLEGRTP